MGRLPFSEKDLEQNLDLLPIQRMGDTGLEKIKYLFQVTASNIEVSKKSGGSMLKLTVSTDHPTSGERINIDDYFSFATKAKFKIKDIVSVLKLKEPYESEDFLGKYFFATVKHETFKTEAVDGKEPVELTSNRIGTYVRLATPQEVEDYMRDKADRPKPGEAEVGPDPFA